jgi:hypothetical protein
LEGVSADGRCRDLASEHDHGRSVGKGVLHGRDDVGRAGARSHEDHADFSAGKANRRRSEVRE